MVWSVMGGRHGLSITYKITPCWVTLLQPARRAAMLGQPSIVFGLIASNVAITLANLFFMLLCVMWEMRNEHIPMLEILYKNKGYRTR